MSSQPYNNNYRPLDAQLIKDVEAILAKLDISQTVAIEMYYNEIARTGTIPFGILNEETKQIIADTDNNVDIYYADSVEDLFADIDNED